MHQQFSVGVISQQRRLKAVYTKSTSKIGWGAWLTP